MFRRTKIIATVGPATSAPAMLERLVRAGTDVVRLNFSHGTFSDHVRIIELINKLSKRLGRPIGIMADLPGPKLRTGELADGNVTLKRGATVTLTTLPVVGDADQISVLFKDLPKYVHSGARILLADGLLELRVVRSSRENIVCKVIVGGELGEHKGINLPGIRLNIPALTKRDREAIAVAVSAGVDYLALSFVQRESDVLEARKWTKNSIPIIAKIEKPQALEHIRSIMRAADGIMIARGDLGVEVRSEEVPVIQKELIRLAAVMSIPVITATQMLDSMVSNPRPTRAETTDVANAIWDGTDAVMLSNETAAGAYPIEAVKTMGRIVDQAEAHRSFQWVPPTQEQGLTDSQAVLRAATHVCEPHRHKAIVTYTKTGKTAVALSKLRPLVPIFALTPDPTTFEKLTMIWGVRSFLSPQGRSVDQMIQQGDLVLIRRAGLKRKDRVIMVAGTRLTSGATNLMKIHQIGEALAGKKS